MATLPHPDGHEGMIGPNAVTRLAEALAAERGPDEVRALFAAAGHEPLLDAPPTTMVDERTVAALHAALRSRHGPGVASRVSWRAGELTGDYLLAHRIPAAARWALPRMPAPLAARALVRAMSRHAWTFAGSGRLVVEWRDPGVRDEFGGAGPRLEFSIEDCALCRGARAEGVACEYYAATFERLFRRLVARATRVREATCIAAGGDACRFPVWW
ncbi:MAG: bacteriochlorophyll 4-vinyl reductase [Steroidobacteraceae bacterium]